MKVYGWKRGVFNESGKDISNVKSERRNAKIHYETVRKMIPPILKNGFLNICKEALDDVSGCIEDETILEVETKPL